MRSAQKKERQQALARKHLNYRPKPDENRNPPTVVSPTRTNHNHFNSFSATQTNTRLQERRIKRLISHLSLFSLSLLVSSTSSPTGKNTVLLIREIEHKGPMVLTQLATGLSVLAGAVLVKSLIDQKPTMMGPRCQSCNGSGRVSCLCSRWSDGDLGCRSCSGSGRMACSSCGGTGTGRPIPVHISVRPPNRPSS
ncbi:hypothetical protein Vadar_008733 [Vaccinium darrowii]|uniref:Uncharacterized protein n=1 Tax=Vaccinium darrowii TaxID=229202 RepID=A0ACB7YUY1_9ERIC|nr:hypothetical protein Vadar_008733 [Vaccinium darrowii]